MTGGLSGVLPEPPGEIVGIQDADFFGDIPDGERGVPQQGSRSFETGIGEHAAGRLIGFAAQVAIEHVGVLSKLGRNSRGGQVGEALSLQNTLNLQCPGAGRDGAIPGRRLDPGQNIENQCRYFQAIIRGCEPPEMPLDSTEGSAAQQGVLPPPLPFGAGEAEAETEGRLFPFPPETMTNPSPQKNERPAPN